jgi:hypothetical protein
MLTWDRDPDGEFHGECTCLRDLVVYFMKDISRIIQSYIHAERHSRYPIEQVVYRGARVCDSVNIIRITIGKDTIGTLRAPYKTWSTFMGWMHTLFDPRRDYPVMREITWSLFRERRKHMCMLALIEFYHRSKNLYEREIHELSDGYRTWSRTKFTASIDAWNALLIANGTDVLRYSA